MANLIGKADMVAFEPAGRPSPVDTRHASRQQAANIAADDVQTAGQALCLSAMIGRETGWPMRRRGQLNRPD